MGLRLFLLIFFITRQEIIEEGWKYVNIEWKCDDKNSEHWLPYYEKYGCEIHKSSDFEANKSYRGVAYGFGQNDKYTEFKDRLEQGKAAGNHMCHYVNYGEETGIYPPDWATGIDCSAFVCRVWKVRRTSSKGLYEKYKHIDKKDAKKGDALTLPGYHTVLIVDPGSNPPEGNLWIMEAAGSATKTIYRQALWAEFKSYTVVTLFASDTVKDEPDTDSILPYKIIQNVVKDKIEVILGSYEIEYTIKYRIYTVTGFEVKRGFFLYTKGKGEVDVSSLSPSIYIIHVYIGDYLRRFLFLKI